jgi:hypothetical protein
LIFVKGLLGNLFKEFRCIFYGLGASIGVKFEGSFKGVPLKGCLWMDEDGGQDEGENVPLLQRMPCSTVNLCGSESSVYPFR